MFLSCFVVVFGDCFSKWMRLVKEKPEKNEEVSLIQFWKNHKGCLREEATMKCGINSIDKDKLDASQMHQLKTSWLIALEDNTGVHLQCLACSKANLGSLWGKGRVPLTSSFKKVRWSIIRHSQSKTHEQAALSFLGVGKEEIPGCPPVKDFEELLKNIGDGQSLRKCNGHSSSSDKVQLMAWTLKEALAERDRQALSHAETISLARDARHNRLLVRFACVDSKFQTDMGVVGLIKDSGDRAGQVVGATREALKRLCTPNDKPPRWYCGPEATLDAGLMKHIMDKTELITTDAAENELVAGDVGRGRRNPEVESDLATPLFPNMKLTARDAPHSLRMIFWPYLAHYFRF